MKHVTYSLVIWVVLLAAQACSNPSVDDHTPGQTLFTTNDDYEVIRDNLEQAIIGRGLVITGVSHVGDMLTRTGADLGNTRQIYTHAEVLEFCSAGLSRRMMEADPSNIIFCPYGIAIYERADEPGRIYLGHSGLQGQGSGEVTETMQEIDALLDSIIREALE